MSNIKMYNFSPSPKGLSLPEGFSLIKYSGEQDIPDWVDICSDGLIERETGIERFQSDIINYDGTDPFRDTYFIVRDSKKIATFTLVPDKAGMGYIHMVACKSECRGIGLGKFIADFSIGYLKSIGKDKIFLLTRDNLIPAIRTYIGAGFLPVNYIDDVGKDMVERWQNIVNIIGIENLDLLDDNGNYITTLYKK